MVLLVTVGEDAARPDLLHRRVLAAAAELMHTVRVLGREGAYWLCLLREELGLLALRVRVLELLLLLEDSTAGEALRGAGRRCYSLRR